VTKLGRPRDAARSPPWASEPASFLGKPFPYQDALDGEPRGGEPLSEPLPRLLSAAEVAVIFNRSARTIRAWTHAGYLRPVRIGRAVFYRADDIAALLDAG
jgi:hypothetical protein